MKKIAAFLELPLITDYPLSKPDYWKAYQQLAAEVTKRGGEFYITRHNSTYLGDGKFSQSWQYQGDEIVETGPVTVEVVFDKGHFPNDGTVTVFNDPFIKEICTDKWLTFQTFPQYSPMTWRVDAAEQLSGVLDQVTTELAVIKPIDGGEGRGVVIDTKEQLADKEYEYPVLVQEFLSSQGGVPGLVEGLHDIRVAIIDGKPIYGYYRTPPTGSYLANVALGGRFEMFDPATLPQSMLDIVATVDSVMSKIPHRFYGVDMAMTEAGPKIIELNSSLGLLPNEDSPAFQKVKAALAEIFMDL